MPVNLNLQHTRNISKGSWNGRLSLKNHATANRNDSRISGLDRKIMVDHYREYGSCPPYCLALCIGRGEAMELLKLKNVSMWSPGNVARNGGLACARGDIGVAAARKGKDKKQWDVFVPHELLSAKTTFPLLLSRPSLFQQHVLP